MDEVLPVADVTVGRELVGGSRCRIAHCIVSGACSVLCPCEPIMEALN